MPSKIRGGTADKHLADMHIPRVSALAKPGAGVTTLILDNFTDADSTAITAHTIAPTNTPATSWTLGAGTPSISSNRVVWGGSGRAWCNAGVANGIVSGDVSVLATDLQGGHGIVMRVQDNNAFWYIDLVGTNNLFRIVEFNGVDTVRASTSFTVNVATYALKAVLSGNDITGTVDGGNQITYNSSALNSQTRHGIRGVVSKTAHDNFKVTTL